MKRRCEIFRWIRIEEKDPPLDPDKSIRKRESQSRLPVKRPDTVAIRDQCWGSGPRKVVTGSSDGVHCTRWRRSYVCQSRKVIPIQVVLHRPRGVLELETWDVARLQQRRQVETLWWMENLRSIGKPDGTPICFDYRDRRGRWKTWIYRISIDINAHHTHRSSRGF